MKGISTHFASMCKCIQVHAYAIDGLHQLGFYPHCHMCQAHLEMQEKDVSSLRNEVETLKSSLAASRTENSMLKSRIEEVNAGQDPTGLSCLRVCSLWCGAVNDGDLQACEDVFTYSPATVRSNCNNGAWRSRKFCRWSEFSSYRPLS